MNSGEPIYFVKNSPPGGRASSPPPTHPNFRCPEILSK